ncbi:MULTISPECIES: carboxymuconolactone decarboxylase family protein [Thermococcus]|uniref:Alkylhydroperoxidase like protein, AhpD family n=1 Tax=Thermococcus sibiricus TaxID=172049 RepID=A0A117L138_9EURY|nr:MULTISPECIES: carboxymuconolactone decarboxylase family protein [Thermococcus]KUK16690.1 MAG: Alkylhydroperoxidase like protein, AhpD family [Thermococcus sibiricus]KUK28725.1 MAG: Alkylhydroperoxidase like protein, AhpD family [Thermococcus sp. 40_45]MBC7093987.1 carboxymuconolactone decarboxylase family protein [Thermococcus sp.]HII67793.1 carboxymuconolactone decarboxylase family protein [Thermococcaceae archaeon]
MSAEKNWKSTLEELKKKTGELVDSAPEMSKFLEYVHVAEEPKALDTKTKELISLAIAVVVHCESCILWHCEAAINAGATKEEILDTLKVAVVMGGGPALMYAVKAYEIAKEFLEE